MTAPEQISRWHSWAMTALTHYDLSTAQATFLRHHENLTFRVADRSQHTTYLLRLHLPSTASFLGLRQSPEALTSELLWLEALNQETALTLPRPVRTSAGAWAAMLQADGQTIPCTLLRWVEGDEVPQNAADAPTLARRLGEVVAQLHIHSAAWPCPPGFVRPVYDAAFYAQQVSRLAPGMGPAFSRPSITVLFRAPSMSSCTCLPLSR